MCIYIHQGAHNIDIKHVYMCVLMVRTCKTHVHVQMHNIHRTCTHTCVHVVRTWRMASQCTCSIHTHVHLQQMYVLGPKMILCTFSGSWTTCVYTCLLYMYMYNVCVCVSLVDQKFSSVWVLASSTSCTYSSIDNCCLDILYMWQVALTGSCSHSARRFISTMERERVPSKDSWNLLIVQCAVY